ncbi:MAG: aminoacyl-histidine dipeptidase [Lachnospiraceae bacterium]|nr:aminoacyl-histidine dipeptidase [Lachnospiraceae bacterium]
MSVLGNLEPKSVFGYFEELCKIPHGSGNMEKISQFCVDFAKEQGLEYIQDDMKNVILIKEATPGYEMCEPLIIQGHLDMVCEKRPDKEKDFLTEGLDLCTDGELIWADGTTLGGDDGIAVAFGLALLADKELSHPRLEVVLTVDEETGLYGAEAIDLSMLKGKKLINIDSEDEGVFTVGCAGGLMLVCKIPMFTEEVEGTVYELKVTGLLGGHSGAEIHKGRANANVVLGRVLQTLDKKVGVDIIKMEGGSKDNAIPRFASAEILISAENAEKLAEAVKAEEAVLKNELHASDAGVTLELTAKGNKAAEVLDATSKITVLHALNNIPNGIQAYSMDIEGLVETSLNMGIMSQDCEELKMSFAVRSSVESAKYYLTERTALFVEMLGGTVETQGDYPGWAYRPESALRDRFVAVYERMYGKKPVVEAIHAGLECGMFSNKIEDLDCISVGPNMHNVHTSEETLEVASVQRVWEFLCEVIKEK